MTIYPTRTPSKVYRDIYIEHYGEIPKDEAGRTFEIHHIDGDSKNNSPDNLIAVSIKQHYDIHYAQGDYYACWCIASIMAVNPAELSRLLKLSHRSRLDAGTHQTQQKWHCIHCDLHGTNLLTFSGHHGDRCNKNPNLSESVILAKQKTRDKMRESQRVAQKKLVTEGKHLLIKQWVCPHCKKAGKNMNNYKKYHGDDCLSNPNISMESILRRKLWSANNSAAQKKSHQAGTSNTCVKWGCPHCKKNGSGGGNYRLHLDACVSRSST